MTLPAEPLRTGSVTIAGTEVPIRALARSEVLHMRSFRESEDDAEPYVIACGTGVTIDEARAWLASVSLETGGSLIEGIFNLTGLLDPQEGSIGEGPDAQPSSEP